MLERTRLRRLCLVAALLAVLSGCAKRSTANYMRERVYDPECLARAERIYLESGHGCIATSKPFECEARAAENYRTSVRQDCVIGYR